MPDLCCSLCAQPCSVPTAVDDVDMCMSDACGWRHLRWPRPDAVVPAADQWIFQRCWRICSQYTEVCESTGQLTFLRSFILKTSWGYHPCQKYSDDLELLSQWKPGDLRIYSFHVMFGFGLLAVDSTCSELSHWKGKETEILKSALSSYIVHLSVSSSGQVFYKTPGSCLAKLLCL